jgi:hypothetical protein
LIEHISGTAPGTPETHTQHHADACLRLYTTPRWRSRNPAAAAAEKGPTRPGWLTLPDGGAQTFKTATADLYMWPNVHPLQTAINTPITATPFITPTIPSCCPIKSPAASRTLCWGPNLCQLSRERLYPLPCTATSYEKQSWQNANREQHGPTHKHCTGVPACASRPTSASICYLTDQPLPCSPPPHPRCPVPAALY